jgi:hypothetical protein
MAVLVGRHPQRRGRPDLLNLYLDRGLPMAAIDAFVDGPAFEPALPGFADYGFRDGDALRGVPVTIAWGTRDWLLIPRPAQRARRLLPWGAPRRAERLRPRSLSRRPRGRRGRVLLSGSGEG